MASYAVGKMFKQEGTVSNSASDHDATALRAHLALFEQGALS